MSSAHYLSAQGPGAHRVVRWLLTSSSFTACTSTVRAGCRGRTIHLVGVLL